jgi:hypothetical protein
MTLPRSRRLADCSSISMYISATLIIVGFVVTPFFQQSVTSCGVTEPASSIAISTTFASAAKAYKSVEYTFMLSAMYSGFYSSGLSASSNRLCICRSGTCSWVSFLTLGVLVQCFHKRYILRANCFPQPPEGFIWPNFTYASCVMEETYPDCDLACVDNTSESFNVFTLCW